MRDLVKDTLLRDRKRRKKSLLPTGFEPTTSIFLFRRHVLFSCATTVAQHDSLYDAAEELVFGRAIA